MSSPSERTNRLALRRSAEQAAARVGIGQSSARVPAARGARHKDRFWYPGAPAGRPPPTQRRRKTSGRARVQPAARFSTRSQPSPPLRHEAIEEVVRGRTTSRGARERRARRYVCPAPPPASRAVAKHRVGALVSRARYTATSVQCRQCPDQRLGHGEPDVGTWKEVELSWKKKRIRSWVRKDKAREGDRRDFGSIRTVVQTPFQKLSMRDTPKCFPVSAERGHQTPR